MVEKLRRILSRFKREETGAVLVEMTLVTPLMIFLSAGVFEFGNLIHKKTSDRGGIARRGALRRPLLKSHHGRRLFRERSQHRRLRICRGDDTTRDWLGDWGCRHELI